MFSTMQNLIIYISSMKLQEERVVVYGNDVDLFVLLLAHYKNIDFLDVQMRFLSGFTPITAVRDFLESDVASVLLLFHTVTEFDVAGKFSGRIKDFWTGKFLEERNNKNFIEERRKIQNLNSGGGENHFSMRPYWRLYK